MSGSQIHGIPSVTFCRVQAANPAFSGNDVVQDGNAVVVLEPGQPPSRCEVSHVVDRGVSDDETCEMFFGSLSSGGLGNTLNPIATFVHDSVNVVVILIGSRQTRKWSFLKRSLLPFMSNEVLSHLDSKSRDHPPGQYRAQLRLSAFDVQDEVICDLLRPASRDLSVAMTLEEGVAVSGLHREKILDEGTLRKLLLDACDNRGVHMLPVGGSVDTSAAVFEFRLDQSSPSPLNNQQRESSSRLIVVDLPAVDPLLSTTDGQTASLLAGPQLHRSLLATVEVVKRLGSAQRAQLAPFRASKLTTFLSELLGGNALVLGLGFIATGEAAVSRSTLDLLHSLGKALHFPLAAREQSDVLRGLLTKYRALLRHAQDVVEDKEQALDGRRERETELEERVRQGQHAAAQATLERDKLSELVAILKEKYETVMEDKLRQSKELQRCEEDNVSLSQTIVQLQLALSTQKETADEQIHDFENRILEQGAQLQQSTETIESLQSDRMGMEAEIKTQQLNFNQQLAELQAVQASLKDAESTIAELRQRNLDLSAEILSLVNKNEVLESERSAAVSLSSSLETEMETLRADLAALQRENKALLERVLDKDEELLSLSKRLLSPESVAQLDAEREKAGRRAVQAMQRKVEEQREIAQQRKLQQLENEIRRLSADLEAANRARSVAEEEAERLVAAQRSALKGQLSVPEVTDSAEGEVALDSLLDSYRSRETHKSRLVEQLRASRAKAISNYRALMDKHQALLRSLEDIQSTMQGAGQLSSEREKDSPSSSTASLSMKRSAATNSNNPATTQALQQTQAQLALMIQSTIAEQYSFLASNSDDAETAEMPLRAEPSDELGAHASALVSIYQQKLRAAEERGANWQRDNIALQVQIQEMAARLSKQRRPDQILDGDEKGRDTLQEATKLASLVEEIRELRRELLATQNQKQQLEREVALRTPGSTTAETALPLAAEPATGEAATASRPPQVAPDVDDTKRDEIVAARPLSAPRRETEAPALVRQWQGKLATAELRISQLSVQVMQLEEELKVYKAYMVNVLPQYQRQLYSKAKDQDKMNQNPKTGTKLPPI